MHTIIKFCVSQFWTHVQNTLFPILREEHHELTPKLEQVIRVLEFTKINEFVPSNHGFVGRPQKDRIPLARAFVAKAVLNLPTTEMLIDRLKIDRALRRICGFEQTKQIPDSSRFSRAFAEFAELELPAMVHEALIRNQLHGRIMKHAALDATAIEANEKPAPKKTAPALTTEVIATIDFTQTTASTVIADSTPCNETIASIDPVADAESVALTELVIATNSTPVTEPVATTDPTPVNEPAAVTDPTPVTEPAAATDPAPKRDKKKRGRPRKNTTVAASKSAKRKRGRPRKNADVATPKQAKKKRGRPPKVKQEPIDPTRIERQVGQSVAQALADLPTACNVGCKKNSKGHTETWIGYKLHIETVDGDIPVAAVLTSASVHDSQVAIPLMRMAGERVTYGYDLADAAYCSGEIRKESCRQGHVPLIDHNPRGGEKIEFTPDEAEHYNARSQAERVNGSLKDNYGGRHVRVKGATKVFSHLMFGILVIAAEQIMRLHH